MHVRTKGRKIGSKEWTVVVEKNEVYNENRWHKQAETLLALADPIPVPCNTIHPIPSNPKQTETSPAVSCPSRYNAGAVWWGGAGWVKEWVL